MTPFSKLSTTAGQDVRTQLENVNGKAANVDDVGNRIGLERTVLCYSSRKCLRIAEDFADADE